MKTDILGVNIDNLTLDSAIHAGTAFLEQDGFHFVVTPNPEFILAAKKNDEFRSVLNRADLSLPDGIGVVYASKILGHPLQGRTPGIDFANGIMEYISRSGHSLFLLGAKPGVAEQAAENLRKMHPGLHICGTHDGYFQDNNAVVDTIQKANADVVFVCLGAPKQELWMAEYGPKTGAKLAIGLGGCLDVFAGNVQRAPKGWQKAGLEWLYRLIKEPSRIGRMIKLPLILVDACITRLRGNVK